MLDIQRHFFTLIGHLIPIVHNILNFHYEKRKEQRGRAGEGKIVGDGIMGRLNNSTMVNPFPPQNQKNIISLTSLSYFWLIPSLKTLKLRVDLDKSTQPALTRFQIFLA